MSRVFFVFALLAGPFASACPDFSGQYEDVERKGQVEIVRNGCSSFTIKPDKGAEQVIFLTGEEHTLIIPTPWKDVTLKYRGAYEGSTARLRIQGDQVSSELVYKLSDTGLDMRISVFDADHKEQMSKRQAMEYRRLD